MTDDMPCNCDECGETHDLNDLWFVRNVSTIPDFQDYPDTYAVCRTCLDELENTND